MGNMLSPEQVNVLKQKLHERETKVRRTIYESLLKTHKSDLQSIADDILKRQPIDFSSLINDVSYTFVNHFLIELQSIVKAQLRMEKQQYGRCLDCYGSIDFSRLSVYPTITRCYDCQLRHDERDRRESSVAL